MSEVEVEVEGHNVPDDLIIAAFEEIESLTEKKDSAVAAVREAIKRAQEKGVNTAAIKKVLQLKRQSEDKRKIEQSDQARYARIMGVELYFQPDLFSE